MAKFKCILHGSFNKHFEEIKKVHENFSKNGIDVLAPQAGEFVSFKDGFGLFEDELKLDPRLVELRYLNNLNKLGEYGFSFFINPEGYIGKSASYELGIAQLTNTRCFFTDKIKDHPAYVHQNSVWDSDKLIEYIKVKNELPKPKVKPSEKLIHKLWQDLFIPSSIVAAGAIIEYQPSKSYSPKEILLVKTHKWGNRFSIVGGKVRRNERLTETLLREVKEETQMNGEVGNHITTFDQIKNSGYYRPGISYLFVDNIVKVKTKKVKLNSEAQEYLWVTPMDALAFLDIEPNARKTLEIYSNQLNIHKS